MSRKDLRELLHPTLESLESNDRTRLLDNGLQWLLEDPTPSDMLCQRGARPSTRLSHESVNVFNLQDEKRTSSQKANENNTSSWSESTRIWMADQGKVKPLPPR